MIARSSRRCHRPENERGTYFPSGESKTRFSQARVVDAVMCRCASSPSASSPSLPSAFGQASDLASATTRTNDTTNTNTTETTDACGAVGSVGVGVAGAGERGEGRVLPALHVLGHDVLRRIRLLRGDRQYHLGFLPSCSIALSLFLSLTANAPRPSVGNVSYVTRADATAESLAYVNGRGNAILKVDNTTTVLNAGTVQNRKSVRLTTKDAFDVGSLIVIDVLHMPFGCSVWPSIWMNGVLAPGQVWPSAGEIDIIEAINLMDHNQMALHSYAGCVQPQNVSQLGNTLKHNCNDTTSSGCTVSETKPNSYGTGFNNANGGAFALQFDAAGIFMWFWSRPNMPKSITSAASSPTASIDLTDWGLPSAAYPAGPGGCNVTQFFPAQQLVIGMAFSNSVSVSPPYSHSQDITLCGLWAGVPDIYAQDCPGTCFASNIAGNGSNYANAYFEIPFIKTWTVNPAISASASASASSIAQTTGSASGAVPSGSQVAGAGGQTNTSNTNAAGSVVGGAVLAVILAALSLASLLI
ncbi:GH16 domain-containing protein [Mycena indigotica]|uniref:GH16 domain-containing protein n=1 Tax=Mycena indigotica TaxID=2126181 RepID=A0A8H6S3Q6_9AGAR|nr:GH16 domain-containing protein [Mycena indigotica]KAF7292153.1 GH16 domain-containing protein [Mycena indigotica]